MTDTVETFGRGRIETTEFGDVLVTTDCLYPNATPVTVRVKDMGNFLRIEDTLEQHETAPEDNHILEAARCFRCTGMADRIWTDISKRATPRLQEAVAAVANAAAYAAYKQGRRE